MQSTRPAFWLQLDHETDDPFIISSSNPKIDGETTYEKSKVAAATFETVSPIMNLQYSLRYKIKG